MAKVKMICSHCGSEDLKKDAWATWNIETQEWELNQVFDDTYCEDCEHNGLIAEEQPIEPEEKTDGSTV